VTTGRAIVVGGGIGGVTAALCLARTGWSVTVLEQAPAFGEVGAGLQIGPNASRVLHDLGLEEPLRAVACLPERVVLRHWRRGRELWQMPLGETAVERYGTPWYHLHRADLLGVLLAAAEAEPAIELRTNVEVRAAEEAGEEGVVQLRGGEARGELVVGADGLHSTVRASLFGPAEARFTGRVAWRATVPAERAPDAARAPGTTVWLGPGRHFVHYPVRRGALVNCVAVVEREDPGEESWSRRGDPAELAAEFASWHGDVRGLVDAMDPATCFQWALFDRDPMPRWRRGRLVLLGDACHPTLPFLAQGAGMAIEDARVLANCLGAHEEIDEALARYELLRRGRTARIQEESRRNAAVFHYGGLAAWARNRALRRAGRDRLDWLHGYDPLRVL
jgi:salicylate hydroxylase